MKSKKISLKMAGIMVLFLISAFAVPTITTQASTSQTDPIKVALVISTAGLGDLSFNDLAWKALLDANETYGPDGTGEMEAFTRADLGEPEDAIDIPELVEAFAADGSYDLIVSIGFTAFDAINASSTNNPNQKFVFLDGSTDVNDNVVTIAFREQEGSFLVGLMAGMTTTTNTVAFLGGGNFELINRFRAGFQQGVLTVNPRATVLNQYSPDAGNPFGDIAGGKTVGLGFIEDGADVIYAAAGATGIGVFNAVNETNVANGVDVSKTKAENPKKVYAIGVDSDQDYLLPGQILASMIKKVDVALFDQVTKLINDEWVAGLLSVGLAEGMVGISPMLNTTAERDTVWKEYSYINPNGDTVKIPAANLTRIEVVNEYAQLIQDGMLIVDPGPGNYGVSIASTPGFEGLATILGLITLVTIPVMVRKARKK